MKLVGKNSGRTVEAVQWNGLVGDYGLVRDLLPHLSFMSSWKLENGLAIYVRGEWQHVACGEWIIHYPANGDMPATTVVVASTGVWAWEYRMPDTALLSKKDVKHVMGPSGAIFDGITWTGENWRAVLEFAGRNMVYDLAANRMWLIAPGGNKVGVRTGEWVLRRNLGVIYVGTATAYHEIRVVAKPPLQVGEPLIKQLDRLATFIVDEIAGEPSQNEGAIDCAIRLLRAAYPPPPASIQTNDSIRTNDLFTKLDYKSVAF